MDVKSKANFINSVTDQQSAASNAPAFAPAGSAAVSKTSSYTEPDNVFAQGLPSWDIVPPQVMVRRRKS